ncbi:DUF2240 domain-containing protein [Halobacteriales archaeon QS_8_69_26]|nr:MAG: DUF2240 domain-containing protein [Halobacteriales archaeon QS_8_69_26]
MSLRVAVAAPFRQRGTRRLAENTFVVALSLDRDWFSPDQAKRLIDVASGEGLLRREDGDLVCEFDPSGVTVPDEFTPDEDLLRRRSPFEQVLDALVEAGHDKREAVGDINRLQGELGVEIGAAAVVYANREGVDVGRAADRAEEALRSDDGK